MYVFCQWRVLQQLENFVLEHHTAGRHGEILADFERGFIGHGDMALFHIFPEIFQTRLERLPLGFDCRLKRLRVGREKICR